MRIAVTYDNGNVFQHFGHTEQFKLYEVEDGKILNSRILGSGDAGHEALADLLTDNKVEILICGGIGPGAVQALAYYGIMVCGGAYGDCDAAVQSFISGTLEYSSAPNCDHHGHEHGEHGCGHHDHGEEEHCGHHGEGHCGCHN